MKKIIMTVVIFALFSGIYFSCKKTAKKDTMQQLQAINSKYENIKKRKFGEWVAIAAADCGGAELGMGAGAPWGPWGVGIGGVVVGACASYSAALCCGGKWSNPETGQMENQPNRNTWELFKTTYTDLTLSQSNQYDDFGLRHNQILLSMLKSHFDKPNGNTINDMLAYDNKTADESQFINQNLSYITSTSQNIISNGFPQESLSNSIASNYSETAGAVLIQFFSNFKQQNDIVTIQAMIVEYENLINTNSTITSLEKQNILRILSVARHSSHFWNTLNP